MGSKQRTMNPLSYYVRQHDTWPEAEFQQLKKEYESSLTIMQIADIHLCTPGCISHKLKKLGLLTNTKEAPGYEEYTKSALYKEIIETSNNNKQPKNKGRGTSPKETPKETPSVLLISLP